MSIFAKSYQSCFTDVFQNIVHGSENGGQNVGKSETSFAVGNVTTIDSGDDR